MKVNRNYLPHLRHVCTTHHGKWLNNWYILPAGDAEATNPLEYEIPWVGNHQLPLFTEHASFFRTSPLGKPKAPPLLFPLPSLLVSVFPSVLSLLLHCPCQVLKCRDQSPTGWQNRAPRIPGSQEKTGWKSIHLWCKQDSFWRILYITPGPTWTPIRFCDHCIFKSPSSSKIFFVILMQMHSLSNLQDPQFLPITHLPPIHTYHTHWVLSLFPVPTPLEPFLAVVSPAAPEGHDVPLVRPRLAGRESQVPQ